MKVRHLGKLHTVKYFRDLFSWKRITVDGNFRRAKKGSRKRGCVWGWINSQPTKERTSTILVLPSRDNHSLIGLKRTYFIYFRPCSAKGRTFVKRIL